MQLQGAQTLCYSWFAPPLQNPSRRPLFSRYKMLMARDSNHQPTWGSEPEDLEMDKHMLVSSCIVYHPDILDNIHGWSKVYKGIQRSQVHLWGTRHQPDCTRLLPLWPGLQVALGDCDKSLLQQIAFWIIGIYTVHIPCISFCRCILLNTAFCSSLSLSLPLSRSRALMHILRAMLSIRMVLTLPSKFLTSTSVVCIPMQQVSLMWLVTLLKSNTMTDLMTHLRNWMNVSPPAKYVRNSGCCFSMLWHISKNTMN